MGSGVCDKLAFGLRDGSGIGFNLMSKDEVQSEGGGAARGERRV